MIGLREDALGEGAIPAALTMYTESLKQGPRREERGEGTTIDLVPEHLPACLDVEALRAALDGTPMAAGVALVVCDSSAFRRDPRKFETPPSEEMVATRTKRRGLSQERIRSAVQKAIMECLRFRKVTPEEAARWPGMKLYRYSDDVVCMTDHLFSAFDVHKAKAFAGAFFVEKKATEEGITLLRVIVDGRSGNVSFWTTDVTFPLFSLEAVMRVIGHLHGKLWFAINADLRHWFHQIPLPDRLRAYYVMRELGIAPVAVPMGATFGPYVGQCCTWGMLFARNDDGTGVPVAVAAISATDKTPSSGLAEETLRRMYESPEDKLPPYLPLVDGGGIFVILDNILVVTPDERVALFWRDRLEAQATRFHAQLKLKEGKSLRYIRVAAAEPPAVEAETGVFEFLGYQWTNGHHRVYVPKDSAEAQMAGLIGGVWKGTHRDLASNLGKIGWWARGRDLSRQDEDMVKLHRLYKFATPPEADIAAHGYKRAWDTLVELGSAELKDLQDLWAGRCSNAWQAAVVYKQPKLAAMVATDASLAGEHRYYGFVCFPRAFGRVTPEWFTEPLETDFVSVAPLRKVLKFLWQGAAASLERLLVVGPMTYEETRIALGELRAILEAVRAVLRLEPDADIVIVASDSLNAKAWVENKWSANETAMALIVELLKALNGRRIFVVYVPSELNCADPPSRRRVEQGVDNKIPAKALLATWRCLQHGWREAQGVWAVAGGQAGGAAPELRAK
jgi:hypothetical protein